jgi:integrase
VDALPFSGENNGGFITTRTEDIANRRWQMVALIGCGLRRSEAARLGFEHIQQREYRWVIVDLLGKHGRIRSVPMPAWSREFAAMRCRSALSKREVFL